MSAVRRWAGNETIDNIPVYYLWRDLVSRYLEWSGSETSHSVCVHIPKRNRRTGPENQTTIVTRVYRRVWERDCTEWPFLLVIDRHRHHEVGATSSVGCRGSYCVCSWKRREEKVLPYRRWTGRYALYHMSVCCMRARLGTSASQRALTVQQQ